MDTHFQSDPPLGGALIERRDDGRGVVGPQPASARERASKLHRPRAATPAGREPSGLLRRHPLSDPSALLRTSVPPAAFLSSAGSGWDGALLADVTAAPAGEIHQEHEAVVIERWCTPRCLRPTGGPGDWVTSLPGFSVHVPGDAQHWEWRGGHRTQLLFVTPERVAAVLGRDWLDSGLMRWRGARHDLPFVPHLLSAMMRDCEAGYPAGPLTGDTLVVALLAYLDRRDLARPPPRPRALGRLHRVLEYVEANLARPLRLAELAGLAGVGVRRFGSLFLAETGQSPYRYVLVRRMERAKALMLDTRLTLAEIALAVGFTDQGQFSRAFRRHTGEAPSAYRRR